ncbi:MAG: DUF4337 family protein [Candidatus Sericytochromatia bacterium]|nr:DUF4337 family protein [Candidatus Sericytochromatia bacterium]
MEKHVEHEGNNFGFASKVALLTALLSTLGLFYSYNPGKTLSDAMMLKNESGISKTEAANQWDFYQAKSTKQTVYEGILISGNYTSEAKDKDKNKLEYSVKSYNKEKEEIQNKAKEFEEESKKKDNLSEQMLHLHHKWSQATTSIQIAISLAAITIFTSPNIKNTSNINPKSF